MPKGAKFGGRVKGTPNKSNQEVLEILERLGHNPFEGMAIIAMNELPCGVCRGSGKTPYKTETGDIKQRKCESCYGTLYEACSPELRGKMDAELAQYVAAKRKAVEHSGQLDTTSTIAEILRSRYERRVKDEDKPLP